MSVFVSSVGSRSEILRTKAVYDEFGWQLRIVFSNGSLVILDYDDAVKIAQAIEDFRHEATEQ